jgi:anti-sigma28 factor (negative regulator of flagellin synthesis)
MKVEGTKGVETVDRAPPPSETAVPRTKADKVSDPQLAALVDNARMNQSVSRAAKLEQLEAAIKSGGYRANPQQIAEQLLSAAEVDAKLQAMLRG